MNAFGTGNYYYIDDHTFNANFGGRQHTIVFNNDYTEFTSTRIDDNDIIQGKLISIK